MILFVSGAHRVVERYPSPPIGWLVTPRSGVRMGRVVASGVPWACDNDCYQRLDRAAYVAMLRKVAAVDRSRLHFVTAPDVVADSAATRRRFVLWAPALRYLSLPIAFVAQDGQTIDTVPWRHLAALFIGGTTRFKLGAQAAALILESKRCGVWAHVGRVSTLRRRQYLSALDVDSIDGSIFARQPDKFIPWFLPHLAVKQHGFMEVLCSS